jgi:hypothetical protein
MVKKSNANLSKWNVSRVNNMARMFQDAEVLT